MRCIFLFVSSSGGSPLQLGADFHRNLPVGDLTLLKMGAGIDNLQPSEVLFGGRRLGDGVLHRILDALGGGTDEFDLFVSVIAHKQPIGPEPASVE